MNIDTQVHVDAIKRHWVARCVENGVPLQDYLDITDSVESWSQWCAAWSAVAGERLAEAGRAEAQGSRLTAAQLRLIAALEFHFGKFLFVHDMDVLRSAHARGVDAYRAALPDLPWPGQPFEVVFGDAAFPGVVRLPEIGEPPYPTVIVVPGLDATKEELHRFQEVFLARGMATVCFDGPGQGEAEYDHPLRPDWEVIGSAAVDAVLAHRDLDGQRVGLVGVSLGGYYAARTAASEPRLRCAVSLGGCYNFGAPWDRLPFLTRQAFQVRAGSTDDDHARKFAGEFDTGARSPAGGVPFLVVHGARDTLFDNDHAERMAAHFGDDGELWIEPHGNHVLHNLAHRVRPAVADWVARRLELT